MRKISGLFFHILVLLIVCVLPACTTLTASPTQTIPVLPTSTPLPLPTLEPTATVVFPQPITSNNATLMKAVGDFKFNQPMKITWRNDSRSFWVVNDTSATRFSLQTGQMEYAFNAVNPGRILSASADSDSILYLNDNQNVVMLFHPGTNKTLVINPETVFDTADFSPDGSRISIPSLEQLQVSIWDANSGLKLMTLKGYETAAPVYDASIGADNRTLIWHSRGTIQLQSMNDQHMGPVFSHEDFVMGFTLSNDGGVLASTAGGTINGVYTPVLYLWDAHSGTSLAKIPYPDSVSALSFSPDGKLLAGASAGNLIIWDTTTYKVINVIQGQSKTIYDLSFSPDGKSMLSSSIEDNQVKLWQVLQ
jgi:WD40 repeat protein